MISLIILSTVLSTSTGFEKPIQILSEESYTLNYTHTDGQLKGYAAELIRAVMDDTGLDYQVTVKPWTRTFQETIATKDTLIYSIARTAEREEQFIWIGKIITLKNFVYGLSTSDDSKKISVDELKQHYIAVAKDSVNHHYLKRNNFKKIVYISSYAHAFTLLKRGRVKYFTSSTMGVMQYLKKNNLNAKMIEPIMPIHNYNPTLYFAANIQTEPSIIKKVKGSFNRIIENGTYHKIMKPLLIENTEVN